MNRRSDPMSITTFVDYLRTSDARRFEMVMSALDLYEGPAERDWDPRYYRALGEKLGPHLLADAPADELRLFCSLFPPNKERNYLSCVEGFLSWRSKRSGLIVHGAPQPLRFEFEGFRFSVAPELDLTHAGRRYWIKCYFKSEELTLGEVSPALDLFERATRDARPAGVTVAFLDLRHGHLLSRSRFPKNHETVLQLSVRSLRQMWDEGRRVRAASTAGVSGR